MSNPYNQEPPRFNNSVGESPYGQTIGGSHQQNNIQQGIKKLYYLIYFITVAKNKYITNIYTEYMTTLTFKIYEIII